MPRIGGAAPGLYNEKRPGSGRVEDAAYGEVMARVLLVLIAAVVLLPAAASARDWRPGPGAVALQAQGEHAKKGPAEFQRGRRDFQRRERHEREERERGRLTEEERRDLHHDLDRARREIYPPSK
jgi:hypothetical protein